MAGDETKYFHQIKPCYELDWWRQAQAIIKCQRNPNLFSGWRAKCVGGGAETLSMAFTGAE